MHLPSPVDRILKPATTIILIIISIFQKEKNLNHLEIIKSVLSRMETIVLSFINTIFNFQPRFHIDAEEKYTKLVY